MSGRDDRPQRVRLFSAKVRNSCPAGRVSARVRTCASSLVRSTRLRWISSANSPNKNSAIRVALVVGARSASGASWLSEAEDADVWTDGDPRVGGQQLRGAARGELVDVAARHAHDDPDRAIVGVHRE